MGKNNAVRLGLIEDSDDAYRQWKNRVHKANLRDITIGTAGAGAAMGLASLFTMANPASMYAYAAIGLGNLPNQVDKIKYDINTKLYAGATADFFKNLRSNENLYGDNMRDLLHMYDDENLVKLFAIE